MFFYCRTLFRIYYTRVFNQNDGMKKRFFFFIFIFKSYSRRRSDKWGGRGRGTPNLSVNLSVSPGAPTRKSHCRWIRVFRYICSYLQTGKYKFTTSYGGVYVLCVCVSFFRRKKEETATRVGILEQFYQDKQI